MPTSPAVKHEPLDFSELKISGSDSEQEVLRSVSPQAQTKRELTPSPPLNSPSIHSPPPRPSISFDVIKTSPGSPGMVPRPDIPLPPAPAPAPSKGKGRAVVPPSQQPQPGSGSSLSAPLPPVCAPSPGPLRRLPNFGLSCTGRVTWPPLPESNRYNVSKQMERKEQNKEIQRFLSEESQRSDSEEPVRPVRTGQPGASAAEELMSYLESEANSRTLSTDELVQYATAAVAPSDPQSYKDAMRRNDSHLWQKAVDDELAAMDENSVWVVAELPAGRTAIRTKWVLKVKQKLDGTVERYKARLVAQGFAQKPHLDYTETFAPVAKFGSIRAILAVAAIEDMEIHLLDVSNAFLNGNLEEEIYIHPPEGSALTGKVLRLCKSLYGLKQSPRAWYNHLDATFKSMGSCQCPSDNSVWVCVEHQTMWYFH